MSDAAAISELVMKTGAHVHLFCSGLESVQCYKIRTARMSPSEKSTFRVSTPLSLRMAVMRRLHGLSKGRFRTSGSSSRRYVYEKAFFPNHGNSKTKVVQ